ncbi:MAG TPA: hypothetical protein DEA96_10085, partial [Leptospiraceae bacterium]|nr:hypothetical protein [Leptospiraceae bacterium]
CFVTGAEERSIRGLTFPLQVSRMGSIAFSQIPGIGRKASSRLFADLGLRKGNSESEIQNWLTEQGARLVPADSESPATAVSV